MFKGTGDARKPRQREASGARAHDVPPLDLHSHCVADKHAAALLRAVLYNGDWPPLLQREARTKLCEVQLQHCFEVGCLPVGAQEVLLQPRDAHDVASRQVAAERTLDQGRRGEARRARSARQRGVRHRMEAAQPALYAIRRARQAQEYFPLPHSADLRLHLRGCADAHDRLPPPPPPVARRLCVHCSAALAQAGARPAAPFPPTRNALNMRRRPMPHQALLPLHVFFPELNRPPRVAEHRFAERRGEQLEGSGKACGAGDDVV